jgi:hypothetical protein
MTAEQKFDLIRQLPHSKVEIRRYHECTLADVVVNADYTDAGSIGFRPLISYISQNNISMTAPVIQEPSNNSWIVSFVMPDGMSTKSLPIPSDSKVKLRHVASHTAAALTFSGVTTESKVKRIEKELRDTLENSKLISVGAIRIARFDPPWKPGFLRKNELILEIQSTSNTDL